MSPVLWIMGTIIAVLLVLLAKQWQLVGVHEQRYHDALQDFVTAQRQYQRGMSYHMPVRNAYNNLCQKYDVLLREKQAAARAEREPYLTLAEGSFGCAKS